MCARERLCLNISGVGGRGFYGRRSVCGVAVTLTAGALLVAGCSDEASVGAPSTPATIANIDLPEPAQVWVEGEPIPGLDETNLWCTRPDGAATFRLKGTDTSGDGTEMFVTDLTNSNPPQLVRTTFEIDGVRYVTEQDRNRGSAEVEVNGNTYTVTGVAVDADTHTVSKAYEAVFGCYR